MATATPGVNPYAKPNAAVAEAAEESQEVRLFSTSGRIGRARYMAYWLGLAILFGIVAVALGALVHPFLGVLVYVALLVIGIMLTIQRCHDFNTTGWLTLILLVPIAPIIFLIIPGTEGPNRFGPPTPPNGVLVLIGAWAILLVPVIGIIAAVTLPAYQEYGDRARQKQMQQQQQQAPKR